MPDSESVVLMMQRLRWRDQLHARSR